MVTGQLNLYVSWTNRDKAENGDMTLLGLNMLNIFSPKGFIFLFLPFLDKFLLLNRYVKSRCVPGKNLCFSKNPHF